MNTFQVFCLQTDELKGGMNKDDIIAIVERHAQKAKDILNITWPVNITVNPNSSWVIPETGEAGYTPNKEWIQLSVDITGKNHNLEEVLQKRLPGTIYHEMNHILRWGKVGYGSSLLEAIISEGVATVFEQEMWKEYTSPWASIAAQEISEYLEILRKRDKSRDKNYNHSEWFFGTNPEIPRWLGYKIGTHIVTEALERSGGNIIEISSWPPDKILKNSGVAL